MNMFLETQGVLLILLSITTQGQGCLNPSVTNIRSASRTSCTAGKYKLNDTTCCECPEGKYQDNYDFIYSTCYNQPVCSRGSALMGASKTRRGYCYMCNDGFYSDVDGATECKTCTPGYYTEGIDRSYRYCLKQPTCGRGEYLYNNYTRKQGTCRACLTGTFWSSTTSICETCPSGFYSDTTGSFSCKRQITCDFGEYFDGYLQNRLGVCRPCPSGKYQELRNHTHSRCDYCQEGKVGNSETGSYNCPIWKRYCGYGEYNNGSYLESGHCVKCPPGQARNSERHLSTSCFDCLGGSVQPKYGQAKCVSCPQGEYQDLKGQTSCKPSLKCGQGQYYAGGNLCRDCSKGWYMDEDNHFNKTCKSCPDGQYSDTQGSPSCKMQELVCPAGSYLGTFSKLETCYTCPRGEIKPMAGLGQCIQCPMGKYKLNHTYCRPRSGCPKNQFNRMNDCTKCFSMCRPGRLYESCRKRRLDSMPYMGDSCSNCDYDEYQDDVISWNATCKKCPFGQYRGYGKDNCTLNTLCPSGQKSSLNNGCQNCYAGEYQDVPTRNLTCKQCPQGYYSEQPAATKCLRMPNCSSGTKISYSRRQPSCLTCDPGTYMDENNHRIISCKPCQKGYYSHQKASKCDRCPNGQYTDYTFSRSCRTCEQGKLPNEQQDACVLDDSYCSEGERFEDRTPNTTSVCIPCEVGKYGVSQSFHRNQSCLVCPKGLIASPRSSICTSKLVCHNGYYYNGGSLFNGVNCVRCKPNTYQEQRDHLERNCKPQVTCSVSEYMQVGDDSHANKCIKPTTCEKGWYINVSHTTTSDRICETCPSGKTTSEINQDSCEFTTGGVEGCAAGERVVMLDTLGVTCEACPYGEYQTQSNSVSSSCIPHSCTPPLVIINEMNTTAKSVCVSCDTNPEALGCPGKTGVTSAPKPTTTMIDNTNNGSNGDGITTLSMTNTMSVDTETSIAIKSNRSTTISATDGISTDVQKHMGNTTLNIADSTDRTSTITTSQLDQDKSEDNSSSEQGISVAAIVGGVVGAGVVLLFIVVVVILRRRRKQETITPPPSDKEKHNVVRNAAFQPEYSEVDNDMYYQAIDDTNNKDSNKSKTNDMLYQTIEDEGNNKQMPAYDVVQAESYKDEMSGNTISSQAHYEEPIVPNESYGDLKNPRLYSQTINAYDNTVPANIRHYDKEGKQYVYDNTSPENIRHYDEAGATVEEEEDLYV
eukprot:m.17420 g.17420  ORF g.17420 m.17420 type:complete len:1205 (+) comp6016_c0_seq1:130-3744(+)